MIATYEQKAKAHSMVALAIKRGDLVRKPCEVCGDEHAVAHHDDYAKPLDVKWLCTKHHIARHVELGFGVPDPDRRSKVAAAIRSGESAEDVAARNGISVKVAQAMASSHCRRRGRPPAVVSAELRAKATAAVQEQPTITAAEVARRLEIDPTRARQLLAELRAVDLAPPARTGADGRALAGPPPAPGRVVRIPARVLARLEQLPGAGTIEQIEAALDAAEREAKRTVAR